MKQAIIVDHLGVLTFGALVECAHKRWKEGDQYPKACKICVEHCNKYPENRIQIDGKIKENNLVFD
jgi:hypothetical protein